MTRYSNGGISYGRYPPARYSLPGRYKNTEEKWNTQFRGCQWNTGRFFTREVAKLANLRSEIRWRASVATRLARASGEIARSRHGQRLEVDGWQTPCLLDASLLVHHVLRYDTAKFDSSCVQAALGWPHELSRLHEKPVEAASTTPPSLHRGQIQARMSGSAGRDEAKQQKSVYCAHDGYSSSSKSSGNLCAM